MRKTRVRKLKQALMAMGITPSQSRVRHAKRFYIAMRAGRPFATNVDTTPIRRKRKPTIPPTAMATKIAQMRRDVADMMGGRR